ncbi:MAG: tRNA 2-thiouridine(34) synthase MnmA [Flavobacteriaceae bacterium]|nr:tRNA 2-thiouridine(34) synthase MnmA [Flavobacteriaceae bacterium]PHX77157.1 MAG: tRNA 2-thiouridine(34) synthase MnmA [Flavobacteriales bacterium]
MARIVVGMSGGVDSSVVALLLKQQGHEVIGLFMRNWNDASVTLEDECPWIEDSRDAMLVAEHLGIPFQVLDLSGIYKERIVDYMFEEYGKGRTPNPDVLCNREIKFDVFLDEALKLGADYVATGHYVRKEVVLVDGVEEYRLMSGLDKNKDQSYFLCQLNQFQLSKALFPIGDLEKSEVRRLAAEGGLATATKKDSQGLCFIGHVSLPDFLQQQLKVKEGDVVEIDANGIAAKREFDRMKNMEGLEDYHQWHSKFSSSDGRVVGNHQGAHFYTRGQRRGLQIGGKPLPLFVLQTDVINNVIFVGQGEDHPGLLSMGLFVLENESCWVRPSMRSKVLNSMNLMCKYRYRQTSVSCTLQVRELGYQVAFKEPQKSITSGQFVAIYLDDEIVFSGAIF